MRRERPADKLTCDEFKKLVIHGMMSGSTNFTMLHQIEDVLSCMYRFQFVSEKEYQPRRYVDFQEKSNLIYNHI